MKTHRIVALSLAALLVGGAYAADAVKSGPQVNDDVPGPFHPLNVTGAKAGAKNCLYCQNGANPVAVVFVREVTPQVTKLIKKLDQCTAKNDDCRMGSYVVFLCDKEGLDKDLKAMADKEKLEKIVLSIDNPAGPEDYKINKDADVTVLLYARHVVKANYAFKKGELKDSDIEAIVKDVPKILPKKK
jgi:transcriptional/translational regulatory protein YebC/TACO1